MGKSDILSEEECLCIIRKKLNQESMIDFTLITYEIKSLEISDNGMLGCYFNLKAKVAKAKSPKDVCIFNFFVKVAETDGSLLGLVKFGHCYEREIFFYNTIWKNIFNPINGEICIPDCYLTVGNSVLVLEDMTEKGFTIKDRFLTLDLEHCNIVMENLALFHAKSIIFEEERKTSILEFCQEEKIPLNLHIDVMLDLINFQMEAMVSTIDLMSELTEEVKEKYKAEILSKTHHIFEKIVPSEKERNVLCHFDLWICNIFFKYNANGKADKCCFIDFQWTRYGVPALDLLNFLYANTSSEFRNKNCQILYKIYYERLSAVLKEAKIDIVTIFTWDKFLELLEEMKIHMILYMIIIIGVQALRPEARVQLKNGTVPFLEIFSKDMKEVESYKEKILDMFVEVCALLK